MKNYEFPDKEFKVIIFKRFSEFSENTDRQFNEIRKNALINFNGKLEIIKKNQTKFSS